MKDIIKELLDVHVKVQLGTYFTGCQKIENELMFAYSDKIEDFYWNYAFNLNCSLEDLPDKIQLIRDFSVNKNKGCTIYVTNETKPQNIAEILNPIKREEEVWMVYKDGELNINNNKLQIQSIINDKPDSTFMSIFDNSYSVADSDSPGYTSLPKEYLDCISNSKPVNGASSAHFIGYNDNEPAAVASIFMFNGYAGLYNVGTHHSKRRNGFGIEISKRAINYAIENKCHTIFLQTQADSEVEELYSKVGFKRIFVGTFITV